MLYTNCRSKLCENIEENTSEYSFISEKRVTRALGLNAQTY